MTLRISRRLVIGAAVLGTTGAGLALFRPRPVFAGENMDAPTAHAQAVAGAITLIDIRRPDEWQATGIGEGAQPLDMRADDFVRDLLRLVGGDASAPVALICARGVRSARLSARLLLAGFANVINVPEGMLGSEDGPGWIARGLPVRQV